MSTFDVSTSRQHAGQQPATTTGLADRTLQYGISLGQNARQVVARVRAASATAAITAYSLQTGIPSTFLNAAEL